ncbi:MAG: hypothetical protein DRP09_18825 [Candidatus Thorarchaeota archaeon]|nr:MAG: hypothetical protein DRP09_18825 [Candidatus Thorarchaeota archaeon]
MAYNPFDKPIQELDIKDVNKLIDDEVAEGYKIEYKSEFQSNSKIAKSIASFANSYGGWYFVGVEADKTRNVATNICGFSLASVPDPIAKVRDVIKSHIDPVPMFYSQLVKLEQGQAVLVIHIPDNQETPFITRDGRIYRRLSDSSTPVPETDRYAVDRLVDRGKEIAKRFERFCQDERFFCQAEENQGWVNVFLSPYPLGTIRKFDMLSSEGIEKLLHLSQNPIKIHLEDVEFGTGNLPLDSGQLAFGSVVLRQVTPCNAAFNSLTVEFFLNGRAKFFIPLQYISLFREQNTENLKSSKAKHTLKEIWKGDRDFGTLSLRFFDIVDLWLAVLNLVNFYQEWLGIPQTDFRVALVLENVRRSVPFCDTDQWGDHVQKFGLPVLNKDSSRFPETSWMARGNTPLWIQICPVIGMGFGLPPSFFPSSLMTTSDN